MTACAEGLRKSDTSRLDLKSQPGSQLTTSSQVAELMSELPLRLTVSQDAISRVALRNGLFKVSQLLSDLARRMMPEMFGADWLSSVRAGAEPKERWVAEWGAAKAKAKADVLSGLSSQ